MICDDLSKLLDYQTLLQSLDQPQVCHDYQEESWSDDTH
jgi:hypothetical protein